MLSEWDVTRSKLGEYAGEFSRGGGDKLEVFVGRGGGVGALHSVEATGFGPFFLGLFT